MRCCLTLLICSLAIGSTDAAEFGGPYQHPSQKGDGQPRDAGNPRDADSDAGAAIQESGFYQAGPRAGAFEGASGAVGIRGGGITLPELKLALPTLELPSLFHSRHGARMVYKGGEAPWISTGFEAVGASGVAGRSTDALNNRGVEDEQDSRSRGANDDCLELRNERQEYQRKLEELDQKLEKCDKMSQILEENIRNQAASTVPPVNYFGNAEVERVPIAAHSARRQMRLPSVETSSIQPAAHWTTSQQRQEPRLLERLPRETMARLPSPTTTR